MGRVGFPLKTICKFPKQTMFLFPQARRSEVLIPLLLWPMTADVISSNPDIAWEKKMIDLLNPGSVKLICLLKQCLSSKVRL